MRGMNVKVFKVPADGPEDVSGIKKLIVERKLKAKDIVAVIGKTEGNGCVNDFSRGYAVLAIEVLLSKELGTTIETIEKKVSLVMSGGTEGVMSPHFTVFAREKAEANQSHDVKRLAVSVSHTRDFLPEEIGTMAQVNEVAKTVEQAIKDACIEDKSDIHFVQIKCPLLTSEQIAESSKKGKKVTASDTLKSMAYSRAASALGIALAVGEINKKKLNDDVICKDWSLYSGVASTSSGVELMNCEIVVMGNSKKSVSDLVIGHSVMKDAIDAEAVKEALRDVGMKFDCCPSEEQLKKVVNVFAKSGADPSGKTRGRRHTMLTDSMIPSTRHARAAVSAVIASIVGDTMIYVSGGAEHQGPAGGGPVAVIAKAE